MQIMDSILNLCAALAASVAGVGLFRLAGTAVGQVQDKPEPWPKHLPPKKVWLGLMAASNVALALFLPLFYSLGLPETLRTLLMCTVLWTCAWADCQAYLIPNKVLLAGILVRCALLAVEILLQPQQARYLATSTLVATVAMGVAAGACRLLAPGSVGFGDVKLFAVMGFCLGMELVWEAVFCSLLVVFLVSLFLLASKKATRNTALPFAPFLLLGTLAAAFLAGI